MRKSGNVKVFRIPTSELDDCLYDFNVGKLYVSIMNGYGNVSTHKGHINVYSLKDKQTMSYRIAHGNKQLSLYGLIELLGLNSLISANKD